jgi:hypothetical protein
MSVILDCSTRFAVKARAAGVDVTLEVVAGWRLTMPIVAAEADFDVQWRLVVEFLKEYHQEPAGVRLELLEDTPGPVGDERWDVLLAGLAEHLAMRDAQAAPGWSVTRGLRRFWFPFDTPGARAQALVHAPAAFRRRGVFVADYEIDAA